MRTHLRQAAQVIAVPKAPRVYEIESRHSSKGSKDWILNYSKRKKLYRAIVWIADPAVPGKHVNVYAANVDDARTQLEAKYGAENTYSIRSEEEASQPRGGPIP
jgi:hypothetical protein